MKTFFYSLCFLILFNYNAYSEEWINIYPDSGGKLQVALPDGYCDVSNTAWGKIMGSGLEKKISAAPLVLQTIYRPCIYGAEDYSENSYPWGYMAILSHKLPHSMTQEKLSKLSLQGLGNKDIMRSVTRTVNDINQEIERDIKLGSFSAPKPLWDDETVFIFYTIVKSKVYDIDIVEVCTASIMLNNQYAIYNYIYENFGEHEPLKHAQLFLKAAQLTKNR